MHRQMSRVLLIGLATVLLGSQLFADQLPTERLRPALPAKGDPVPAGPGHVDPLIGGPDAFGYTFIDSTEPGGPTFSFVDISATGTAVALGDDAEGGPFPMGFDFPFYGTIQDDYLIVSNGYVTFQPGSSGAFTNDCPYDGDSPPDMVGVYWDDLDPGDDAANAFRQTFSPCPVVPPGSTGASCTVVQYEEFDAFPGDGVPGGSLGTFQVIMYSDGYILYQYQGGPALNGSSATIGISQDGGANSLLYTCNTSSISAGLAILFIPPATGDLAITKMGDVILGGNTNYTIEVTNNGPDDQTGVEVTDMIPAEVTFVGDTCGGSLAGSTWTWTIGNLAAGVSASCTLTVELDGDTCVTVENTATVTGDLADPTGNNSSTTSNGGGESVQDPSFEAGTPNPEWAEASTNFGTPLCTVAACGTGTGTGPRTGLWWTWFGGIAGVEEGSVTQDVFISPGVTEMTFWLEMFVCNSAVDFMEVTIDGTQVYMVDGSSPLCGVLGYSEQTVDISAFADGAMHTLEFHSITSSGGVTNFFVDDVSLPSEPVCGMPQFELTLEKEGFSNGDGTGGYNLWVTNEGPGMSTGVIVTDTLPGGVAYLSNDCGATFANPTLTWNVPDLAMGEMAHCEILVEIDDPDDTLNTATASGGATVVTAAASIEGSPLDIPTLNELGLALLAFLLAVGAAMMMRRRRNV